MILVNVLVLVETSYVVCFKICFKAVHRRFFAFDFILDQYKTQEISSIVVSLYPFLIVYCPDKYETQKMFDEAVHDSLATLKLIPDWFVTSNFVSLLHFLLLCTKMIVYSFFDEDFGDVTFCCN